MESVGRVNQSGRYFSISIIFDEFDSSKHCKNCGEKIEPCFFDGEGMEMIKTNISATLDRHNKERFSTFLQFLHFLEDVNYVVDGMWINHHFLFKENKKYLSTMELEVSNLGKIDISSIFTYLERPINFLTKE